MTNQELGDDVYCAFCRHTCDDDAHIMGSATADENPWCCDDCWDERLR